MGSAVQAKSGAFQDETATALTRGRSQSSKPRPPATVSLSEHRALQRVDSTVPSGSPAWPVDVALASVRRAPDADWTRKRRILSLRAHEEVPSVFEHMSPVFASMTMPWRRPLIMQNHGDVRVLRIQSKTMFGRHARLIGARKT